ncbi:hypothetical protein [Phascolarctobacterium succinatutens]|uniref:hypothetical protein n=2 Tax=Phascolarctobacterium succinatutens TaxID=626940 RepID=UPI00265F70BC|nr:hypothetical protein [Phascolarctobacterium succinatutens]
MLTSLKNNRSLTFYQQTKTKYRSVNSSYAGGVSAVPISGVSFTTMSTTNGYNAQLNEYLIKLNTLRARDAQRYNLSSPNQAARNMGVKRAWMYEKADIEMGGSGSANWSAEEKAQILKHDSVRGAEGHHQQNVSDHPEQQANPDNIKFYKTKDEHLQDGHDGNWDNESNQPLTDKNKMLEKSNSKRVFKNELKGLGLAVAIGSAVGLTIGFITTLAQSGITPDTLKLATIEGLKSGAESGMLSAVGYGIGEVTSQAISGVLKNTGITIAENISKMVNMVVVGALTIVVFSTYQFIKLKLKGVATREALIQTGKQALFSLSLLAVSIAVQGIWGGAAVIIVSVSIGFIMITYSIVDAVHQRHFAEKIRIYTIGKCYPSFSV